MNSICLSIIVKNEAHCIKRCLDSVKPFISYWVICDDLETTDNTEEIVKECLKDIPGEYHRHKWEDFATNRNKSLEIAKQKADYVFIIDADDYIKADNLEAFSNLDKDAYSINIVHDPIVYSRVQLFNSKLPGRYVGILHEYLELPNYVRPELLQTCQMIYGATGARAQDPKKFLYHAQAFEKALLTEPDNARYVFYAAQSYRDAGMKEESLKLYQRRSKMGGWIEEQYMSLLEVAKLTEVLSNNINDVENAYLAAFNLYPIRVEALSYLCTYCRKHNLFQKAYFYSKVGCTVSKPDSALFSETSCYDWKIKDELAVAAYWIGNKQESASLNKELLKSGVLPDEQKERILNNLRFSES